MLGTDISDPKTYRPARIFVSALLFNFLESLVKTFLGDMSSLSLISAFHCSCQVTSGKEQAASSSLRDVPFDCFLLFDTSY